MVENNQPEVKKEQQPNSQNENHNKKRRERQHFAMHKEIDTQK